jgi:hypothetical protein
MDLRLATLKAVFFYLLHNVSTLNQCRNLSCGTVVYKHIASYQGYTNNRWDLTISLLMYIYGAPCKARNLNVVYIYGPTFGNAESSLFLFTAQCFNTEYAASYPVSQLCVNTLLATKVTLITDGI